MPVRVLFQNSEFVAVDKPAGFHTHSPEDSTHRISPLKNVRSILKAQLGGEFFPVHRLDVATSGVLIYARTSEAAARFQKQLLTDQVQKTYLAVVRGHCVGSGTWNSPLEDPEPKAAVTHYEVMAHSVCSKLSLVKLEPVTGRRHQLRRHLRRAGHPILGDRLYGDRALNKELGIQFLALKAYRLDFSGHSVTTRWGNAWHVLFDRIGICPWLR